MNIADRCFCYVSAQNTKARPSTCSRQGPNQFLRSANAARLRSKALSRITRQLKSDTQKTKKRRSMQKKGKRRTIRTRSRSNLTISRERRHRPTSSATSKTHQLAAILPPTRTCGETASKTSLASSFAKLLEHRAKNTTSSSHDFKLLI